MGSALSEEAPAAARTTRRRPKERWIRLHLYLGLSLGLLFSVLGLTGSLNVYKDELDKLFNPDLFAEERGEPVLPFSTAIAAAAARVPTNSQFAAAKVRVAAPSTAIIAFTRADSEVADEVHIDRTSGRYLGTRVQGGSASEVILRIHAYFFLDAVTTRMSGIVGIMLLISVCSGLYIWWPRRLSLAALKVHFRGSRRRLYFELHRTAGALASAFLLLSCVTGLSLIFPEPFAAVAGPSVVDLESEGGTSRLVSLDDAVAIAQARFPNGMVRWIDQADEPPAFRIIIREHDSWFINPPDRRVWIEQASGQPIRVRDISVLPPAAAALEWFLPLHAGEALGPLGRMVTFLIGLMPALLFLTGFRLWMIRRRKPG
jgi:uncharacterized iron-regulated membrane protein